jgi:hypothetical protein
MPYLLVENKLNIIYVISSVSMLEADLGMLEADVGLD